MVYFRIEDIDIDSRIYRNYQIPEDELPVIKKQDVEYYIAEEIRKEVNGSNDRILLSYSKSLGVCLLKYNEYTHNELHICYVNDFWYEDYIQYITPKHYKCKLYSLYEAAYGDRLFRKAGKIILRNFVMNIADNSLLNKYLVRYTKVGLKQYASPEKDHEVVMMQAYNDIIIERYIDSVYILYALQLKYNFLRNWNIVCQISNEINQLDDFRFDGCEQERTAIIFLVQYLYSERETEILMNNKIFQYAENKEHISIYYDSLLQYHGIMHDDFEESYYLSDYNDNVVSEIFWKYCMHYKIG